MSMNFYLSDITGELSVEVRQTRTEDTKMILGGYLQFLEGQEALEATHRYFELLRGWAQEDKTYYEKLRAEGGDVEDWEIEYPIERCEEHVDEVNRFINFVGVERLKAGYV